MIIGIDLGATQIRAGVCQSGSILTKKQAVLKDKDVLSKTISQITNFIAPLVTSNVEGIGIGVPSVVDIETGTVYNTTNISSWEKVELKKILEREFNLPVHVNNDANCYAYGAYKFGLAEKHHNMVGITLGTGLGVGLVINGKPFCGNNCGAGEMGLVPYLDKDYEAYCSSSFFETNYNISAQRAHTEVIFGSKEHLPIWEEYGEHLGQFIKLIVLAYDPSIISIGGSISNAFDFFKNNMWETLQDFTFPESIKRLKIEKLENDDMALIGAAELLYEFEKISEH